MQGAAFVLGKIVTFIVRDEVDYGPFTQGRRLVKHDAPVLNTRSEGAHVLTIRPSVTPRNAEGAAPAPRRNCGAGRYGTRPLTRTKEFFELGFVEDGDADGYWPALAELAETGKL